MVDNYFDVANGKVHKLVKVEPFPNSDEICYISNIPDEILMRIVKLLKMKYLVSVSEVSKKFYSIANDPLLWKYFSFAKLSLSASSVLSMLNQHRFSRVEKLNMNGRLTELSKDQMKNMFSAISKLKHLKILLISRNLILDDKDRTLDPVKNRKDSEFLQIFTSCISNIEEVHMASVKPSNFFLGILFEKLYFSDTKLRRLNIAHSDLSNIRTSYFVEVVRNLEVVDLYGCIQGSPKVKELFQKMTLKGQKNSKLRKLNLSMCNFQDIPTDEVAGALNTLEEVELDWSEISEQQTKALFLKLSEDTNLKSLSFTNNDLSSISPNIFSLALNNLEDLDLSMVETSVDQLVSFFTQMGRKSSLRKLRIESMDLSLLSPGTISSSISRLTHIILSHAHLTRQQLTCIIQGLGSNNKLLVLSGNDISQVPLEIFAKGLSKIQNLSLSNCNFTKEQIQALHVELAGLEKEGVKGLHFGVVSKEQAEVIQKIKTLPCSRLKLVVNFQVKYCNNYRC